jgi:MFS family permease
VSAAREGAWTPLRHPVFRALWLAALISTIGSWMQTVGAQWLLLDQPHASTLVALVQTASNLPILMFALPAGVLAEFLDRRLILLGAQAFQTAVGVALVLLTQAGQMSPALLLLLTFLLGAGAAAQLPAYQAMIPDLVPTRELKSAAALGSIGVNIARAIGPAIAGLLISHLGVTYVFAINASTFALFFVVLVVVRVPSPQLGSSAEGFLAGLAAGGRYTRHAPVVRRILLRLVLFLVPANVLWALLAVLARERLGLGAGGYGVLLGLLGIGSVFGAALLPRLRTRVGLNLLVFGASMVYATTLAALATVRSSAISVLLLLTGAAWIAVIATLNAETQTFLPAWVRARGLSIYQLVLFGTTAAASAAWGVIADAIGVAPTFAIAAALLVATALTIRIWPLLDTAGLSRLPAEAKHNPTIRLSEDDQQGPVAVTITYTIVRDPEGFMALASQLRNSRLRTGGRGWRLLRDGENPQCFVETFTVASLAEHHLQQTARLTGADQEVIQSARDFSEPPPTVAHLFLAPTGHGR